MAESTGEPPPHRRIVIQPGQLTGQRAEFAEAHLHSAALLARRVGALEHELLATTAALSPLQAQDVHHRARVREDDERYTAHLAYVIGAILTAVAAMEAAVNNPFVHAYEAFMMHHVAEDKAREQGLLFAGSLTPLQAELARLWIGQPTPASPPRRRDSVGWAPLDERARAALTAAHKTLTDIACWNDVTEVLDLRHLLSHFYAGTTWVPGHEFPDATDPAAAQVRRLQKSLAQKKKSRGRRAIVPSLLWWGYPFPYPHLTHQCAAWAVTTARRFIVEFSQVMDLLPSPLGAGDGNDAGRGRPSHVTP